MQPNKRRDASPHEPGAQVWALLICAHPNLSSHIPTCLLLIHRRFLASWQAASPHCPWCWVSQQGISFPPLRGLLWEALSA